MIDAIYIKGVLASNFISAGAIIAIALISIIGGYVALLGLGFGISRLVVYITGDESARIGGFYLAKTPYKGYKRFHSQEWNMEHMP
jgi:hypothetical protein